MVGTVNGNELLLLVTEIKSLQLSCLSGCLGFTYRRFCQNQNSFRKEGVCPLKLQLMQVGFALCLSGTDLLSVLIMYALTSLRLLGESGQETV